MFNALLKYMTNKSDLEDRNDISKSIFKIVGREHISAIESVGFDDYLIKPFAIEELEIKSKHFLKIS